MKGQNKSSTSSCNIHPVDVIEGVCPLCLNERLLVVASLQRLRPPCPPSSYQTIPKTILQNSSRKKPIRLFSFFSFFELRHHKSDHQNTSIISPEDSFISINFEDNRATSWEKGKETKKEIVPQSTPLPPLLSWRKRIRRLLHVISFKSRSRACHLSAKVKSEDDLSRSW
ncbi:unnamed protein product [Arabidopsis thaliana]|uniref:Uncharacterized protein n=1 Tax=Arabidopsis thaliana TaxID=3702 RepID=A0A654EHA7_ARATH|nr:unnamed protein product [Arabidopsis thaliana]